MPSRKRGKRRPPMNQPQRVPAEVPILSRDKIDERNRRKAQQEEAAKQAIMQKWENLTFAIYTKAVVDYNKLDDPKEDLTQFLRKCAVAASAADSMWGIELGVGGKTNPVTPVEE